MPSMNETRKSVCDFLELLSSEELQKQFHLKSPTANVALELLCLWFSELYHPGSQLFSRTFSPEEHTLILEFNRHYDKRKANVPATIEQLHFDSDWQTTMHEAKKLLNKLKQ